MTYSICVRERAGEGWRFGTAAATRLPAVGSVCPHVSDRGAVAVGGVAGPDLGRRCLDALDAGRSVDEAVDARADDASANPTGFQLHGVDARSTAVHTGDDCPAVAGHAVGEGDGDAYTVAGTSLTDEAVLDALARGYRENERAAPLAYRLLTALAAAEREGGDRRDLPVGSAAVVVETPGDGPAPLYHDLRVDASDSPVADLRETYRQAKQGYEAALDRYGQTENS